MTTQSTLNFLAKFFALSNNDAAKQWDYFQNFCDTFVENILLPSQVPQKSQIRTALSGVLRRIHMLSLFPELIGKQVICLVGFPTARDQNVARLLGSIPHISLQEAKSCAFNAFGKGLEMSISEIAQILESLSGKNNAVETIFSALRLPEKLPQQIVYIKLAKECSYETTFFQEILETADDIILSAVPSPLSSAVLAYLQEHRPNIPIWIGNAQSNIFKNYKSKYNKINFKNGYPEVTEINFTPFSFLFQWALQPVFTWIEQQNNELKSTEMLLTNDLIMANYVQLKESLEDMRSDIKNRRSELDKFKNICQQKQQELLHIASEFDKEILQKYNLKFGPSIDNWLRAEELLLCLAEAGDQYLVELQRLNDNLRQGDYPYDCILDCMETMALTRSRSINSEILRMDRPIAHRLCIRLRDKLGITDSTAGYHHATLLDCKNADEWYVRGTALMNFNPNSALHSFRKALELGESRAGSIIYNDLLVSQENQSARLKTEKFLLKFLVPEMCFEKAMRMKNTYNREAQREKLFLLYISAAQDYIPAIREVAKLEGQKASSKNLSEEEQSKHRKIAIGLYKHVEEKKYKLNDIENYILGLHLYKEHRFTEALHYFKNSNDMKAMRYIGRMYHYGDGVEINENLAETYYTRAIQKGDNVASELLQKIKSKRKIRQNKTYANSHGDYRPKRTVTSSPSSSSDSLCFLTTATCKVMNYDDNCDVLQKYRHYRDEILAQEQDGPGIIRQYYEIAPEILKKIDALPDPMAVYSSMWHDYLLPGYQLLLEHRYTEAKLLYIQLVTGLTTRFNIDINK